jgi:hypothetical protein
MKATIEWPIRSRRVQDKEAMFWVNFEAVPVMRQMRTSLNQVYRARFVQQTAGTGVFTPIWTSPDMAAGTQWLIDATVQGKTNVVNPSAWMIRGLFYSSGGVNQAGATTAVYTNAGGAFAVQFLIVGDHVEAQVQDDGLLTVDWQCWIELREHPQ